MSDDDSESRALDVVECVDTMAQMLYKVDFDLTNRREVVRMIALFDGMVMSARSLASQLDFDDPDVGEFIYSLFDGITNNIMCALMRSARVSERQARNHLANLLKERGPQDDMHEWMIDELRKIAAHSSMVHLGIRDEEE
jgi:hypothetical protein